MKLAWLVWNYKEDDYPEIMFEEPEYCYKKLRIVFAIIDDKSDFDGAA